MSRLALAIFRLNAKLLDVGNELVADLGLTTASWQVLDAVVQAERPLSVAQIARNMGLKRQSVQRTANMMEAAGLIRFEPNPDHRRAKLVALNEAGERARRAAVRVEEECDRRFTGALDRTRVEAAIALINDLDRLFEQSATQMGLDEDEDNPARHRDTTLEATRQVG